MRSSEPIKSWNALSKGRRNFSTAVRSSGLFIAALKYSIISAPPFSLVLLWPIAPHRPLKRCLVKLTSLSQFALNSGVSTDGKHTTPYSLRKAILSASDHPEVFIFSTGMVLTISFLAVDSIAVSES